MREYSGNLKTPSRELRKEMTEAEKVLWTRLRRKQLLGVQFYRQKPIGPYIVDFFAPQAGLVIEADGSQHLEPDNAVRDQERDRYLADSGLLILRFNNYQILRETDAVVEQILIAIGKGLRKSPPAPLS